MKRKYKFEISENPAVAEEAVAVSEKSSYSKSSRIRNSCSIDYGGFLAEDTGSQVGVEGIVLVAGSEGD